MTVIKNWSHALTEVRLLTSFWRELLPWWIVISPLHWSWLFIVMEHALNSESTDLELSKLTQFSCSGTENSEFPSQSKSTLSSSLNSEFVEPPYWNGPQAVIFVSHTTKVCDFMEGSHETKRRTCEANIWKETHNMLFKAMLPGNRIGLQKEKLANQY